jgi:hypothetical protein
MIVRGVWARLRELGVPEGVRGKIYDTLSTHNAAITGGLVHQVLLSTFDNPMATLWHVGESAGSIDLDVLPDISPIVPDWNKTLHCPCPLPCLPGAVCLARVRWCDRCRTEVEAGPMAVYASKQHAARSRREDDAPPASPLEAVMCGLFLDSCASPGANGVYFGMHTNPNLAGATAKVCSRKRLLPREVVRGDYGVPILPLSSVYIDFLRGIERSGRLVRSTKVAQSFCIDATRIYCRMGSKPMLCIDAPYAILHKVALIAADDALPSFTSKYHERGYSLATKKELNAVPKHVTEYLLRAGRYRQLRKFISGKKETPSQPRGELHEDVMMPMPTAPTQAGKRKAENFYTHSKK